MSLKMRKNQDITSYIIYNLNEWYIVLFLIVGLFLPFVYIMKYAPDRDITFSLIIIFSCIILGHLLTKKVGLRPIKVVFDDKKIVFQYLTKDLKTVKKEKIILMKYINEFSDFTFGNHNVFKLKLFPNTTFSLYKNGFWNREDDFERLIRDFKEFIENQHSSETSAEESPNKNVKIKYKDFFQTKKATLLFYGAIIVAVWAIFKTIQGSSASSYIVIGGMVGYIGTYLTKKANRK